MFKEDDILEAKLKELEEGRPLDEVIRDLPEDQKGLAPLIRLAARTRFMLHPSLSVEKSNPIQQALARSIRNSDSSFSPLKRKFLGFFQASSINASPTMKKKFINAAVIGLVAILFVSIGIWAYGASQVSAHSATLKNVSGLVEVSNPGNDTWSFVTAEETIKPGQEIRTYAGSGATLAFLDGSQTTMADDTDVTLTSVGSGNKTLQVVLTQHAGSTSHNIIPFKSNSGSYFQVKTPGGEASVHGTIFGVDVSPEGNSLFSVDRGVVQVNAGTSQVLLTAGQATLTLPDGSTASPAYQFILQGKLTAVTNDQWTVAGVTFKVDALTLIESAPQPGNLVSVRGRIPDSGDWIADRIDPIDQDPETARFTGPIVSMGDSSWTVGKTTLNLDANTKIDAGLKPGDPVEVTFEVLPGGWLAKSINAQLTDESQTPTPSETTTLTLTETETQTATTQEPATVTVTPTQTETPEENASETVTLTPIVTTTPTVTATPKVVQNLAASPTPGKCGNDAHEQPEGLVLAQRYHVTYDEIMGWFCQGFGFGEIDLAYSLSQQSGKSVADIFAMRESGLGWGQIKQQLGSKPGHGNGKPGKP